MNAFTFIFAIFIFLFGSKNTSRVIQNMQITDSIVLSGKANAGTKKINYNPEISNCAKEIKKFGRNSNSVVSLVITAENTFPGAATMSVHICMGNRKEVRLASITIPGTDREIGYKSTPSDYLVELNSFIEDSLRNELITGKYIKLKFLLENSPAYRSFQKSIIIRNISIKCEKLR